MAAIGFVSLALGAIGVFLPVWPTTPFVIISAACFSSTPKLKAQIMRIGFFREHIRNYEEGTGLSRKTLLTSIAYLWTMLLISMALVRTPLMLTVLCVVGVAVTVHILVIARKRRGR